MNCPPGQKPGGHPNHGETNTMTNVTTIEAGRLDRLASRIKDDIDKIEQSREDWVETTLDLAAALAEARKHFPSNNKFSAWFEENQFLLGKNERMALIAFGEDIERARAILGKTESRSVQIIYSKEFRLPSARNTEKPKTPKDPVVTPETQRALDAYDQFKGHGVEPTQVQVQEKAGVSNTVVRRAFTQRKAEEALLKREPDLGDMPKSWKEKYERALGRAVAKLEAEYNQRRMAEVERHINEYLMPLYREKLEKAERVMAISKRPFTVDEFRQLLAALHPDSTPDRRAPVFNMVKEREHLLRPPERDKPFTSSLPQTLEELLKRRKRK